MECWKFQFLLMIFKMLSSAFVLTLNSTLLEARKFSFPSESLINLLEDNPLEVKNCLNQFFVDFGQSNRRIEMNPASFFFFKVDIWWLLIKSNAHRIQFSFQQIFVHILFSGVQNHENQICCSGHSNDLSTSTFSLSST